MMSGVAEVWFWVKEVASAACRNSMRIVWVLVMGRVLARWMAARGLVDEMVRAICARGGGGGERGVRRTRRWDGEEEDGGW